MLSLSTIRRIGTRGWLTASGVLSLLLVGQLAYYRGSPKELTGRAVWAFHPANIEQVRDRAHTIVRAVVTEVNPGRDIILSLPQEPDGEDRIPTERITVKVLHTHKGSARPGDELEIFRTGGQLSHSKTPSKGGPTRITARLSVDGDPTYRVNHKYLLMLVDGPEGTLRPVSPEGRFRIEGTSVQALVTTKTTAQFHGKPLAVLEERLK